MLRVKQTHLFSPSDLLIFPFFEGQTEISKTFSKTHIFLKKITPYLDKHPDFEGKYGEFLSFHTPEKNSARILLVGLGEEKKCTGETIRRLAGLVRDRLHHFKITDASLILPEKTPDFFVSAFTEGFLLASYSFQEYFKKPQKKEKKLETFIFITAKKPTTLEQENMQETLDLIQAVITARDLTNTPANHLNPTTYPKKISKLLNSRKIKTRIIDHKNLAKLGAGAILGVGQGSDHPPCFIVFEYKSKKKQAKTISIIGKGITFDTGGLNLKPMGGIETMKLDMAGSATVVGLFQMLSQYDLPVNVIGVIALAENAIGPKALHPGDVITTYNGKTVEITNTDAEGRLVLADALSYVQDTYKPDVLVDIATLTGASWVALGQHIAPLLTNSDHLLKALQKSSAKTGEKIWQLPLDEDLQKAIKGEFTDYVNYTPSVMAGTIMGGCFVHAFVEKNTPWAHLDIAGTGWANKKTDYCPKGGTGSMIRLLWDFLKHYE